MTGRRSERSPAAYDRFATAVEPVMIVLAVLLLPLLVVPMVWQGMPPAVRQAFVVADYVIWAAFTAEYVVKLRLAPDRWSFVRRHIPDLVLVVVPVLRPLRLFRTARVLRLFRVARLASTLGRSARGTRGRLRVRATTYVIALTAVVLLAGAAAVYDLERGTPGANIGSFGDALWWAFVTVTTVGYGDRFPVTAGGRAVGALLMLTGIALLGVVTASIAAAFVDQERDAALEERLARIEALLQARQDEP